MAAPSPAAAYAALLDDLEPPRHPALEWAASGGMALTGPAAGPPVCAPGKQAARLTAAAAVANVLARGLPWWSGVDPLPLDEAAAVVGWRAAAAGLTRQGDISCGARTHLVGGVAASLPRPDDVDLLHAWGGESAGETDPWEVVARGIARMGADEAVARAQLLRLPFSRLAPPPADGEGPVRARPFTARAAGPAARASDRPPSVVDLTSLWAGPLCTLLLTRAGARVVKVEAPGRPDGSRSTPAFFDVLNRGKRIVAVDLADLGPVLDEADVVVESFPPRVMANAGIDPETWVARSPGRVWVSITGYGRDTPWRDRVALGDDAAAAGGIVWLTRDAGGSPVFCADAYADPATGIHAASAALGALAAGGGLLVNVAMADVVAHLLTRARAERVEDEPHRVVADNDGWVAVAGDQWEPVAPPRLPGWPLQPG